MRKCAIDLPRPQSTSWPSTAVTSEGMAGFRMAGGCDACGVKVAPSDNLARAHYPALSMAGRPRQPRCRTPIDTLPERVHPHGSLCGSSILLTLKLVDGVPVKPSDGHRWPARRGHDGDGHRDGGRHGVADDRASTMAGLRLHGC